MLRTVASVVEWLVRSAAVREVAGSNPTGDNVVIPVFPPKVTCPPSSNRNLAMRRPPCECDVRWSSSSEGNFVSECLAKVGNMGYRACPLNEVVAGVKVLFKAP